jgi:CBS domain-containing protein
MLVTVRDLMTSDPATVDEYTSIAEATQILLDNALTEVFVVDRDGRLMGTVSDYGLFKASLMRANVDFPVTTILSRSLMTLRPELSLQQVAGFFRESCYGHLAVLEDGHLVGVLGRRDVLRALVVLAEIGETPDTNPHRRIESAEVTPPKPAGLKSTSGLRATLTSIRSEL